MGKLWYYCCSLKILFCKQLKNTYTVASLLATSASTINLSQSKIRDHIIYKTYLCTFTFIEKASYYDIPSACGTSCSTVKNSKTIFKKLEIFICLLVKHLKQLTLIKKWRSMLIQNILII